MRNLVPFASMTAAVIATVAAPVVAAPAAAVPAPRETVEAVAKAIDETFYDAAKASRIAADLRAEAARGAYDAFDDPRVLAVELTRRLKPLDAHFNVEWRAPAEAPTALSAGPGSTPPPQMARPQGDPQRRANYGFRRVEILPGNLGYIDMRMFAGFDFADDKAPARRAADAALSLVSGADAVIIDLRGNGGGSPAMVGYLSSAFTRPGADIYNTFHSREGTESEAPLKSHPMPNLDVPLYILISGRTGSAAEAFAYTMKNAGRAVVVGEASAGAANPGGTARLPGGFVVFISDGSPRSPVTGTNWEGTGVVPDVAVPSADALAAAQRLALEGSAKRLAGPMRTEAEWALAALTQAPAGGVALAEFTGDYSGLKVTAQGDRLRIVRGRRPSQIFVPMGGDLFRDASDPATRVRFQRDGSGKPSALEILFPDGPGPLYRRGA